MNTTDELQDFPGLDAQARAAVDDTKNIASSVPRPTIETIAPKRNHVGRWSLLAVGTAAAAALIVALVMVATNDETEKPSRVRVANSTTTTTTDSTPATTSTSAVTPEKPTLTEVRRYQSEEPFGTASTAGGRTWVLQDGRLRAFDTATGGELRVATPSIQPGQVLSGVTALPEGGALVHVVSGSADAGSLLQLDARGSLVREIGVGNVAAVAVDGSRAWVISTYYGGLDGPSTVINRIDLATGEKTAEFPFDDVASGDQVATMAVVDGTPYVAAGTLYRVDGDGPKVVGRLDRRYAIQSNGSQLWALLFDDQEVPQPEAVATLSTDGRLGPVIRTGFDAAGVSPDGSLWIVTPGKIQRTAGEALETVAEPDTATTNVMDGEGYLFVTRDRATLVTQSKVVIYDVK